MSTSYSSNTVILDDAAKISFENSESMSEASIFNCLKSNKEGSTSAYDRSTINEVYNSSRGGWVIDAIGQLCSMADIKGLEFLYSCKEIPYNWKFSIDSIFADEYGYLLDKQQLELATAAISDVFNWSSQNTDKLSNPEFLGYFTDAQGIQEALKEAIPSLAPGQDPEVAYSEDGDGPWYLFSLLRSVQQVMLNALKFNKRVLHTVQIPD